MLLSASAAIKQYKLILRRRRLLDMADTNLNKLVVELSEESFKEYAIATIELGNG